jgi:phosphoserine phosphatase RsbU/P
MSLHSVSGNALDTSQRPAELEDSGVRTVGKARVLVVDDNEDQTFLVCERLTHLGYLAEGVVTAEAALARLADAAYDVVLLDVSLPGMDGLTALEHIRRRGDDVAVIVNTAYGSEQVAIDALRHHADDYVPKGCAANELESVLRRTVARLKLDRQNAALRRQLDEKRHLLEAELGRAARVQADLLPADIPTLPGFEIAARCVPAREVGGDFYDWQMPEPSSFTFTLSDVMGKGMPAALLMATVRAAMRAVVRQSSPSEAMRYVVPALAQDLERSGSLVTLFLGKLDLTTRQLAFVDAGHGHVFVRRASGQVELLEPRGLPLGVTTDAVYPQGRIDLAPGDVVVVYSDGIIDAEASFEATPYRIADLLGPDAPAATMLERVLDGVGMETAPPDDLTLIVLRCSG